jgi:hypothetical protein
MKSPINRNAPFGVKLLSLVIIITITFTLSVNLRTLAQEQRESSRGSMMQAARLTEDTKAPANRSAQVQNDGDISATTPDDSTSANNTAPSTNLVTVTSYPFTSATGVSLDDMSTGTTQLVGASQDDTASSVTNIGFDFWYDGTRATQFSVNANGLMRLGATQVSTGFSNSLGTTTDAPKIGAYWDDQCTGANGKIHFKVTGSAPNRKLIAEWQNMQITRGAGCSGNGNGTYQVWLFETTGVIQFVYGSIQAAAAADGGYSVGLQSGAATNFASVTTTGSSVSYATANNTQTNAIASGTSYSFTPNIPLAPSGLNFTGTSAIATTLNWTDNSSNEVGFVIYRSTDGGTTYSFLAQTAANATSFTDSTLAPSSTYFYQVQAVTEGARSSAITNNVTTNAAGNIASTAAGGNWSSTGTWVGGIVPTANDNVTIADGATVTVEVAANAYTIAVGTGGSASILQFEQTTARTLTVGNNMTIAGNGTVRSNLAGTVTGHILSVTGDLTNNGVLDLSTNANTAGAGLIFTGATNNTFGGTGGTTDIRILTINKGTSFANVLEITASNFTVQGTTVDGTPMAFLSLANGTLKVSGTFTMAGRVFTAAAYTIGTTAGFWLNNPNFTVSAQNGSPAQNGLLRISQGTFNVGTAAGNSMTPGAGASITIEGGAMNVAGRLSSTTNSGISYTQSGGTLKVSTAGNTSSSNPSFGFETGAIFTMSGGTIILQLRSTGGTPLDYSMFGTFSITGGTLQVGNASTLAASSFVMRGGAPTMLVDNSTAGRSVLINGANSLSIFGNLTLNTGTTLSQTSTGSVVMSGNTSQPGNVVNNGTISNASATGSNRVQFFGAFGQQTYSGSGTFGSGTTPYAGVGISNTNGVSITAPMTLTRVNLFNGVVTGANNLTFGNGGASSTLIQIGQTGGAVPGGMLDAAPTFSTGSGGHTVLYLQESVARTTGFEIPPAGTIANATVDNTNGVNLSGNLNIATTLTLNNGNFTVGANTLTLNSAPAGTATNLSANNTSSLVFNGTTAINVPSSIAQLNNFTLNNVSGSTLQANLTIQGALTLSNGALNLGGKILELDGSVSTVSGTLTGGGTSAMVFGGGGAVTMPGVTGGLQSLTLNRAGTVTLGAPVAVTGSLNLTAGQLNNSSNNVTLSNGALITRDINGLISNAPIFGTTVDVQYVSALTISTGPELPTSAAVLRDLTNTGNGTVSLTTSATVNGTLNLSGNNFVTGPNVLTVASGAAINRTNTSYVDGTLARGFASATSLGYPIGGGIYAPVTVNALSGTFPATLAISTANSPIPGLVSGQSLGRQWVFGQSGIAKATLAFSYAPTDVPNTANPALFRVVRKMTTDQRFIFPNGATDNVNEGGNTATATAVTMPASGGFFSVTQSDAPGFRVGDPRPYETFDFDGEDARTDVSVWNGTTRNWTIINSLTSAQRVHEDWGSSDLGDKLCPGDYDGDGRTDLCVWRPSEGNWYIIRSSNDTILVKNWGDVNDRIVPGDYDGDGKTDFAVFRPSEGNWYVINSSNNTITVRGWGDANDKVVPADYDGDGKTDFAVFRPSEGNWYIINSGTNTTSIRSWGAATDQLVPGDYDGDGRADAAVYRPSEGNWYVVNSSNGSTTVRNWGASDDLLVPGDYDRDGLTDFAVFRPSEGNWYIINSSTDATSMVYLGSNGDVPVPSAYLPQ